ncbi:amidophosphoribosyltransferase [Haloactinospora alba]|uniref:Amidophosphoribosyltransferase n=1 Tax=Haloactinospora alba TaxID=405555 RepID=A0A543N6S2_9ACTN|nr:amidophosphoribosyltransferase [Haloactinospora alba]
MAPVVAVPVTRLVFSRQAATTLGDVAQSDGRPSTGTAPTDRGPQDACGVFGVWAPGEEVSKLTYFGLYALQHRGQESAGMALSDGERSVVYKDMGLVSQVFDEATLESLHGHVAIGHCRYSTTGSSVWENAQPTFHTARGGGLALGHNGNLINTAELAAMLPAGQRDATTDTEILTGLLANSPEASTEDAAMALLPHVRGAFCLVFMDENTLYAARDPQGVRPFVLGQLESGGWVAASETAALDIVGAAPVREIEPGELVTVDDRGVRSRRFAPAEPKGCLFEYVYLARPDTTIAGRNVNSARVEVGKRLAREHPVDADLVIPVPESGTPAAVGYAEGSGVPFAQGLVKNSYVGRTFIEPSQSLRQLGIRLKLNPLRDVIAGKRLIVVDDSIVRGNTQRSLVTMLREAGAAEVHVRISSPPIMWPCYYGVDFATKSELLAGNLSVPEIRDSIGADSLAFIALDELVAATQVPKNQLCRACFDGEYPIDVDPTLQDKYLLEKSCGGPEKDSLASGAHQ